MNDAVFELQSYIRNISQLDKSIPSLVPDGIYGEETTESVLAFQRKHLLPQTSKVNFDTWKKLTQENKKAVFAFSEPLQTAPISDRDLPLSEGKESHLNLNVNLMLSRLSDFYKNFSSISVSHNYTEATAELIGLFQQITGITVTGEVDKETWNLLSAIYLLLRD